MVNDETGSVETGLVKIACICKLILVSAIAPLLRVKFTSERELLEVEPQFTVDKTVVPAAQEVLVSPARFAAMARGIPTRTIPLTGILFLGVNVTV